MLVLVETLPDTSAFVARLHHKERWREFFGWGQDRLIASATYDAINSNSIITAKVAGVKRALKIPPYPKPWDRKSSQQGVPILQLARQAIAAGRRKMRSLEHEVQAATSDDPPASPGD